MRSEPPFPFEAGLSDAVEPQVGKGQAEYRQLLGRELTYLRGSDTYSL